jgi:uncharacterized membrane protein
VALTPGQVSMHHQDASRQDEFKEIEMAWENHWRKHPTVRTGDQLSLGEKAADRMRNGMGSWPFVFAFFAVMITWAVINGILHVGGGKGFDPYPFILLNLFLSMLAGIQAAALLIAAKRSDSVASEISLHTEATADDIKSLLQTNNDLTSAVHDVILQMKSQTDLLDEIHRHVEALSPEAGTSTPPIP